jgi:glutathione peroxidase
VPASFFDFKIKDIQGNLVDFAKYKGLKAILVVNVACQCGLTSSNYKLLTQMHNELKDKGFELLAFPCNQFFSQ